MAPSNPPSPTPMGLLMGLTGGIASGKSTVAELLAAEQIPVIDTDQLSRELVEPGQLALADIVDTFGPTILRTDGQLDRAALRQIVFTDTQARALLEAILHPPIRVLAQQRAQQLAAHHPYVVVVIPLLAEPGVYPHYQWLDGIICVETAPDTQRRRLLSRPGITAELADQLIQAQIAPERRRPVCDFVLDNSQNARHLHTQVTALHRRLLARAEQNETP